MGPGLIDFLFAQLFLGGIGIYRQQSFFGSSDVGHFGHFGEGLHDIKKNSYLFRDFHSETWAEMIFFLHVFASIFFSTEIAFTHPPTKVGFGKQESK